MLSFRKIISSARFFMAVISLVILAGCQFQPLHGNTQSRQGGGLEQVGVASVNNRVAQQLRNHLLFLMHGGFPQAEKAYEARLRVNFNNVLQAAIPVAGDTTGGIVTVRASYDLIDLKTGETVASGRREATASYDRTGQVFANNRATRDAEDRAAREAAEALRLAIAADLSKL